ncbi:DNA-processing protein DprA [Williamsia deligens]|uniref:DNA-processing protein DprA n=1 Tax=Williamsia deligens TaxID=321325 RepID=A0ABW3GE28_9NOCA|nr:DNA-processing protein DprA [Williamsia deligens]MCP2195533.1 DNA processing protein [Williamsia deligens]
MSASPSGADTRELRAWAYLSRVAEPPCAPLARLVDDIGASAAADAVRTRTVPAAHRGVLRPTEARHDTDCADIDLTLVEKLGGRLVTPDDDEWPGWALHALATADTASRGGPPLALWVRGPADLADVSGRAVAVVGSRAATSYGTRMAATVAGGLVDHGRTVVSGGAFGIDGAAHRRALAGGGCTVAVLACGVDVDYPAGHSALLAEIARTGAVVSEYAPGTTAARHRFLARNRLVVALSCAVVVVEAGRRSGAKNTAAWARVTGRPLGAVPGPATSAMSVGCHGLIADGYAQLVDGVDAVERLAEPDGGGDVGGERSTTDALDPVVARVREAIPAAGSVTVAEIAVSAGVDVAETRSALARLDMLGLVAAQGSGWSLARSRRVGRGGAGGDDRGSAQRLF